MDAKTMTMPNGDVINLKDDVARAKIGTGTLDTESKELIGAVNELNNTLANKVDGQGFIKMYGSKDARYCKITCPTAYRYGVVFVVTSKAVYQIQANGASHNLNRITGDAPTVSESGDILTIDSTWAYSQWGVILIGGLADYTTNVAFTAS